MLRAVFDMVALYPHNNNYVNPIELIVTDDVNPGDVLWYSSDFYMTLYFSIILENWNAGSITWQHQPLCGDPLGSMTLSVCPVRKGDAGLGTGGGHVSYWGPLVVGSFLGWSLMSDIRYGIMIQVGILHNAKEGGILPSVLSHYGYTNTSWAIHWEPVP